jgi:hypothetical protein
MVDRALLWVNCVMVRALHVIRGVLQEVRVLRCFVRP